MPAYKKFSKLCDDQFEAPEMQEMSKERTSQSVVDKRK